ncbi:MAG TPA: hypothetical protein VFS32_15155 [Candidatus Limnocylindrales bacterium]|nr:hypothetical protein [Candidatus Limnocylindrales bacterium]
MSQPLREPGFRPVHQLGSDLDRSRAWVLGLVVDPDGFVTNASCLRVQLEAAESAWRTGDAISSGPTRRPAGALRIGGPR